MPNYFAIAATTAISIGVGIIWLRTQRYNAAAKKASRHLLDDLKKGQLDFDSLAGSLGMMVRSKPVTENWDLQHCYNAIDKLKGSKVLGKFSILRVEKKNNKAVFITEAVTTDVLPGSETNKLIDVFYPCWIYISENSETGMIEFRSDMPQDKEHRYLLEDLADEFYKLGITN